MIGRRHQDLHGAARTLTAETPPLGAGSRTLRSDQPLFDGLDWMNVPRASYNFGGNLQTDEGTGVPLA